MAEPGFNIAGYLQWLQQRKIAACRCADCGKLFLPPRLLCPACRSDGMQWEHLSGQGKIVAFSSIAVARAAMAARGHGGQHPYVSGFVALKEGLAVPARIECAVGQVHVGMPVQADFLEESNGQAKRVILVFRAA